MARKRPNGQWRNLYLEAMAKPEFKAQVLQKRKDALESSRGILTQQSANLDEAIAEVEAEIAQLENQSAPEASPQS